jgi:hypothetical protein
VRGLSLGLLICLAIVAFAAISEASKSDTAHHRSASAATPKASHPDPRPAGQSPQRAPTVSFAEAARNGVDQLIGLGGQSAASQNPADGLWGGHILSNWWQSALALLALVRYLERTDNTSAVYQRAIMLLYDHNHLRPNTHAPIDFANEFNDDTGWWGVAWLEAARYELYVRHDKADASKFLSVAEWDARFINAQNRRCSGIEWGLGKPPDTITTAEYMDLTAGLSLFREQPGPFHNAATSLNWLRAAEGSLAYMETTNLINTSQGRVNDSLIQHRSGACTPYGRPITYTQGEVADALIQLGLAMHQPIFFKDARRFIDYGISPEAGLIRQGVLREHCEDVQDNCNKSASRLDYPAYKGLLVNAIADYDTATQSNTYAAFLRRQAKAVVTHALVGGARDKCHTAATCFFGFYWTPPPQLVSWSIRITLGGQESGIDALTSALPARTTAGF